MESMMSKCVLFCTARLVLVSNSFQLAKLQVFKRVHKFVPLGTNLYLICGMASIKTAPFTVKKISQGWGWGKGHCCNAPWGGGGGGGLTLIGA